MQYVPLGSRGPQVSAVGFGAWAIGGSHWGPTDDAVSKAALHAALDAGVTFLDTADTYGFGHSEELIAAVLAERGGPALTVATKGGNDFYFAAQDHDTGYGPIRQNYAKDYLLFAAEQSLQRLRVDTLDLYQLHSPDLEHLERDEPWDALATLRRQGKVRYTGLSVQSFKETEQATVLDAHHAELDVLQVRYNLLERAAEEVLLPKARQYGLGIIVRIPLLFGLLTGKFTRATRFGPDDHRGMNLSPDKLESYLFRLEALQPLFARYPTQTQSQVALRFCLTHAACHTVIPGAKTAVQVADNVVAADLGPLTADDLALLAELDPAP
ncbi:MAG: aldo/keto reductase [Phycisphaerales bacterium]|nr:aldo/keto reductase [Phycisphaerales bacterium]